VVAAAVSAVIPFALYLINKPNASRAIIRRCCKGEFEEEEGEN
jgi:hypothetical protein